MKRLLIGCALACSHGLFAQNYVGEAALPVVAADGFYRIRLTPEVVSCLTPGFANVRVTDSKEKEVPYLLDEESPVFSSTTFREYRIEKDIRAGCCTELILHNPARAKINNISLLIRNAETVKDATLLGSDDRKQWYALKERFNLYEVDNRDQTAEIRILDFPLSDYSYYKLTIDDSTTAPLNILKAGYYDVSTASGRYTEIPGVTFESVDNRTEKRTEINIALDTTGLFDMLQLELTGPPFYHRRAELYARRQEVGKRKDTVDILDFIAAFDLTSRQAAFVRVSSVRAGELLLRIDNGDNPTLNVQSVRLYQLNRYLVAWLGKSETYKVKVGEENLTSPVYDIGFFRDSIPADPPQLAAGSLVLKKKEAAVESFTLFTSRNIIWVAIVAVIALLGYMSKSMLRKM